MSIESTISKINKELISAFAALDTWLDFELFVFDDETDETNLAFVSRMLGLNSQTLSLISRSYDHAFRHLNINGGQQNVQVSANDLRDILRTQLYQCLCLLDELESDASNFKSDEEREVVYGQLMEFAQEVKQQLDRVVSMK